MLEFGADLGAGAMQPGFERAQADPETSRRLGPGKAFDVRHLQNGPLRLGQALQNVMKEVTDCGGQGGFDLRIGFRFVSRQGHGAVAPHVINEHVAGDAHDPRSQAVGMSEMRQAAVEPDQDLLGQIIHQRIVAAEAPAQVPPHRRLDRLPSRFRTRGHCGQHAVAAGAVEREPVLVAGAQQPLALFAAGVQQPAAAVA